MKLSKGVGTAPTQQPNGEVWDVNKAFRSGLVTSWNKFCYTGGYLEASVQLPGDSVTPGLWPALWAMGNLARAGYMKSTEGERCIEGMVCVFVCGWGWEAGYNGLCLPCPRGPPPVRPHPPTHPPPASRLLALLV